MAHFMHSSGVKANSSNTRILFSNQNLALSGSSSKWVSGAQTHTYTTNDICLGDSVLFDGRYRKEEGKYFTSFSLQGGCDSIVQMSLTLHDKDTLTENRAICEGDSIEFDGQYLKNEGTYMKTFSSRFGCDSTSIKNIDVDSVNIEVTKSGTSFFARAQDALYQWYNCDGDSIIPGETNQGFIYTQHASYAVIITQNNCTDTSECIYTALGIQDYSNLGIDIFPNPAKNRIYFKGLANSNDITLYDISFKLLKKEVVEINGSIDISDLKSGAYFIRIENVRGTQSERIFIAH